MEVGEYGKFRLNPKQKEIVENVKAMDAWQKERMRVVNSDNFDEDAKAIDKKYITQYPFMISMNERGKMQGIYDKMVISLLESRKKAQANN